MSVEFDYLLLGRLQSDCEYYLNHGRRNPKVLWALEEKAHIEKMKELYNKVEEKPVWITLQDIEEFEKQLIKGVEI